MKNIKDMLVTNCNVKNSRQVHDLPTSVNGKVISPFCENPSENLKYSWVKVFRIIPEFRILRLTFHRNLSQPQNAELNRL